MTNDKRLILCLVLSVILYISIDLFSTFMGWQPRRAPLNQQPGAGEVAVEDEPAAGPPRAFANDPTSPEAFTNPDANPAALTAVPGLEAERSVDADVAEVPPASLVLGSADLPGDPAKDYLLQVELEQRGAGVRRITLAGHQAQLIEQVDRSRRLVLMDADPQLFPDAFGPPLALQIVEPRKDDTPAEVYSMGETLWEVVPDEQGRIVRPLAASPTMNRLEGQQVVFRGRVPQLGLEVTKTIGLRRGVDGLEVALEFHASRPLSLIYRLLGPYGLPIEGEWYTSTFREVFFGKINGATTEVDTKTAGEVYDKEIGGDPIRATSLPLKYAGIENQYFALFLQPDPLPATPDQRIDERTIATLIKPAAEKTKSEVSVVLESKPVALGANASETQSFRVFAGPKTSEALQAFQAEDLTAYRKGWQFPIIGPAATYLARNAIAPMLDAIYGVTQRIAGVFGGKRGSYGIAIILLTIAVRLMMFPLSRKQAVSAKKMQDLQPQLLELREQYKDDKEQIGRETLKLYRKNGVNPFGGCLLVLIQMPIFLGLWQALNNSVALRNEPFLWIRNLAAPDMLCKLPFEIPFIGPMLGPYFNLLPFLVVALMLIQTKLFAPPATSPEMKQQQQVMNVMLIVMAFMFYKVPSGLGLYFITSSLWSISERLLLPASKIKTKLAPIDTEPSKPARVEPTSARPSAAGRAAGNGGGEARSGAAGWRDKLRERLEKVIDEANNDKTVRNNDRNRNQDKRRPTRGGNPPPGGGKRRP